MKLKGNVVCYSRVSTRHDSQEDSLENQEFLLQKFLTDNSGLTAVGFYKDQESGKTTERKGFLEMMERVSRSDVDYILAKNNTRLSRSTEISSSLNRVCQRYGCKIIFVSTGEVYDPTDRSQVLMNSIKAAVAEDYVYQQSELSKLTHLIKCREGRLNRQNETFGFRFNDETKLMDIYEPEAEIVRLVFEWYCFENKGVTQIGKDLAKIGVLSKYSGKNYTASTITKWLTDTAYKGKMAFNKTTHELVTGVGAKSRRSRRPKYEWVYADCPAIVSEELFDLAQKIREERVHVYKVLENEDKNVPVQGRYGGYHLFATKVFCGVCGNTYHHYYGDRKRKISGYRDSFHKKGHKPDEYCLNNDYSKIYEEQLIEITKAAINTFLEQQTEIFDNVLNIITEVIKTSGIDDEKKGIQKMYDEKIKEKQHWLIAYKDAVANGDDLIKDDLMREYKKVSEEVENMKQLLTGVSDEDTILKDITERLDKISNRIKDMQHIETLTREDVTSLVDKIVINPDGTVEVILLFSETYQYKVMPHKEYRKTLKKESSIFLWKFIDKDSIAEFDVKCSSNGTMAACLRGMVIRYRACSEGLSLCSFRRQIIR